MVGRKHFPATFTYKDLSEVLAEYKMGLYNVRLVVGYETIEFNRFVLELASDVFRTMFNTPMKESKTNIVIINDVDVGMMKAVLEFYKNDVLPDISEIDHEDIMYIISKYNFVGIRQAIAAKILEDASATDNVDLYELIYVWYGNEEDKAEAAKRVVKFIENNNPCPEFVLDLSPDEFMKLAKIFVKLANKLEAKYEQLTPKMSKLTARSPKEKDVKRLSRKDFFLVVRKWLSKDIALRSDCTCRILGILDIRGFDYDFVMKEVVTLPLAGEYKILLEMMGVALAYFDKREKCGSENLIRQPCEQVLSCHVCYSEGIFPYHSKSNCPGFHRCNQTHRYMTESVRIEPGTLDDARIIEKFIPKASD